MISNNSACLQLGPWANDTCSYTYGTCNSAADDLSEALTPVIYTLFSIGALYAVDGTIKLTDLGVKTIAACIQQISKKRFQDSSDESRDYLIQSDLTESRTIKKQNPTYYWDKFTSIWDSVFKTGRSIGVAALSLTIAIPLYRLINAFQSKCHDLDTHCPEFKAETIHGCNWANEWLIDVIKEILKGYLPSN